MEINYIGDYNIELRDVGSDDNYNVDKIITNKNTSEFYVSWSATNDELDITNEDGDFLGYCDVKLNGTIIFTVNSNCLIDYMYHCDEFRDIMYDIQDIKLNDFEIKEYKSNIDKNIAYNYIKNTVNYYFLHKNANFEIKFSKI